MASVFDPDCSVSDVSWQWQRDGGIEDAAGVPHAVTNDDMRHTFTANRDL